MLGHVLGEGEGEGVCYLLRCVSVRSGSRCTCKGVRRQGEGEGEGEGVCQGQLHL